CVRDEYGSGFSHW
nr:immunoglobulin heavy chain junction region [Macaca mulatta]MOV38638.1 immunoglobulin heavy chain junction region [Macaca mulatta]MOV38699.1 immunoglobulin heavy chain junction region [Macaca mulatta]MOV39176.1 immunoglobulin heavy chain junction region [Macaca mulatta]MOV39341.1 immunoglobulin heavy chain junction region [Macaca mulatta]